MGTVLHLWGGSCRLCRGEPSNIMAVSGHASQLLQIYQQIYCYQHSRKAHIHDWSKLGWLHLESCTLIEIPNCISENYVYLLVTMRDIDHFLNELYENLRENHLSQYFRKQLLQETWNHRHNSDMTSEQICGTHHSLHLADPAEFLLLVANWRTAWEGIATHPYKDLFG